MIPSLSRLLIYYPLYAIVGKEFHLARAHFENTQWFPYEILVKRQMELVRTRIRSAQQNSLYYKRLFEANKVSASKINSLDDLHQIPILTKKDLAENFDEIVDHRHKRARYLRQTSGSSGTPLQVYKDAESIAAMDAIMYRNYSWFNIDIGAKQARYWGGPLSGLGRVRVRLKDALLNRIRFSPFDCRDETFARHIETLFRFRPTYVYGYAQTIFGFSEYVLKNTIDLGPLNLKTVIVTGEMITQDQIASIETAFKAPVTNEYGCTEVGIIAMQCPNMSMHLMIENLLIEFINEGRHVEPEQEGEIIITELYGSAMPLIRYQVGDIGSYTTALCDCGRGLPLLKSLKGRNDEFIVCADGRRVDPIVFEYILKEIPVRFGKVTRFRITQVRRGLLGIETCYEGSRYQDFARIMTDRLKGVLGNDIEIDFRAVDSILAEPSGKLRCFVSRLEE